MQRIRPPAQEADIGGKPAGDAPTRRASEPVLGINSLVKGLPSIRMRPIENVTPVSTTYKNDLTSLRFDLMSAMLKEGQQTTFNGYRLLLHKIIPVGYISREFTFFVAPPEGGGYHVSVTIGKNLRLGTSASVEFMNSGEDDSVILLFHKAIPTSDIAIKMINCEQAGEPEACSEWAKNTLRILLALEKISGVKMGECYRAIQILHDPERTSLSYGAFSGNIGENGYIVGGIYYLPPRLDSPARYDLHEPQHIMRFCSNIYKHDEGGHIFWEATGVQLRREVGDISATGWETSLINWVDAMSSDMSTILNRTGTLRCTGLKTYLLSKEYVSLPAAGKAKLVKDFHMALLEDPRMLTVSQDEQAMIDIVCSLISDPGCQQLLTENCPPTVK